VTVKKGIFWQIIAAYITQTTDEIAPSVVQTVDFLYLAEACKNSAIRSTARSKTGGS
jgi:hypothetical protein